MVEKLGPRTLEMTTAYSKDAEGKATEKGKNQEVAMAATVFAKLQESGHIPAGAKLSDKPPADGEGLKGTSYEARLVELITDKDKNGKLDLDCDRLSSSGILSKPATGEQLERTLGGTHDGLSDKFMKGQDESKSGFSKYHTILTTKGQQVQSAAQGMTLGTSRDRANTEWQTGVGERIAKGPEESGRVASEALTRAQLSRDMGNPRAARDLLTSTGNALMDAGQYDAAKKVFTEIKAQYPDAPINLVGDRAAAMKKADPSYNPNKNTIVVGEDTKTKISENSFATTFGKMADTRLAQIDQIQRMESTLGRKVDPHNVEDARAYFDAFSKGKSTDAVRTEYQGYLKAFYEHPGEGTDWPESVRQNDRPGQMTQLMKECPNDASGRKMVDCEGFTYLTGAIMGGVKDDKGQPRFDILYAERPGHVVSGVFEHGSNKGFGVNNNDTHLFDKPVGTSVERATAMGSVIAPNAPNVIGIANNPEGADVMDEASVPRVGRFVWDGKAITGVVNETGRQRYIEEQAKHPRF